MIKAIYTIARFLELVAYATLLLLLVSVAVWVAVEIWLFIIVEWYGL